eukprot:700898-Hanusia_phi.AAC.1
MKNVVYRQSMFQVLKSDSPRATPGPTASRYITLSPGFRHQMRGCREARKVCRMLKLRVSAGVKY